MKSLEENNPWLALVLVLIYETRFESQWRPYIDLLPREFDTLMFWTPEELKMLEGSAVLGKIGKEEAEHSFNTVLKPILDRNWELFRNTELEYNHNTGEVLVESLLSVAHRMASCIMSYSFDIKRNVSPPNTTDDSDSDNGTDHDDEETQHYKAMVPLADLLNADANENNARLFQHPSSLAMCPLRPLPAQTLLYNDYGPLPRSDLLRRYGYITQNYAQYDVVEIRGDLVTEIIDNPEIETNEWLSRIDYLINEEVLEDEFDLPVPEVGAKNVPSEWAGIFHVLMQPKGVEPKLPTSSSILKKIAKTRGYKDCVLEILRKRLALYPPIAEIDVLFASKDISATTKRRVEMGRQVREGEIAILTSLVREVEGWGIEKEPESPETKPKATRGDDAGKKRKVGGTSESRNDNGKRAKK